SSIQKIRMEKKERSRRRWQRTLSRQQKGSQNRKKTRQRLARTFEYTKDVRKDVIHKATHTFTTDPERSLFVVEDLRVKNMTKKPEPKKDASGSFLRNGKLVIKVPPHYSSQECAHCGHIHPDNRPSQAEFVCQRCGLTDNADQNASRVIAQRGIRLLLEGTIQKKRVRRCGIGKEKQPGPERSEVKASGEDDKTQRPKGPKAQRPKGPKAQRPKGPKAQRPKGPKAQRPKGPNAFAHPRRKRNIRS
ncbi:MAG: RNA-guided endonuclease InsQ/TnpB family protein, partial [Leptospirillum sp.]